ncbi:MAG: ATP-grasp domain-containing protein, partial [Gemmatimonadales bacterium]
KTEARRRMAAAGVPIVPGLTLPVTDFAAATAAASDIGYPVLVKASAGGGGKGMRIVERAADLEGALATAASEAGKAFGDPSVYLEKYIVRPRHVEIQVLADQNRTVFLGERECSIQRRHQKLVEEAPSAAVSHDLRARMGAAAVAAASAVGYRSAGTCEFLLAADGSFYFLEMNTRIQVEHPVTELVFGVDLVREQLRIAQGLPMRVPEGTLTPRGWAIECRITSEDPGNAFLPSSGRIEYLRAPSGPGIRWDGGFEAGNDVTLYYDSLLGKVIAWGQNRAEAITRMQRALSEMIVTGIATNQSFHLRLLADPEFQRSEIDSQFLDRRADLLEVHFDDSRLAALAVAAALAEDEARSQRRPAVSEASAGATEWARTARRESLR